MQFILNSIHKRPCWSEKSHSDFKQIEYMTFFYFAQSAWYLIYCKVKQTSAEHQTKSQISSLVYAECSQTYVKLVQGERKSKLVCDFSEPPPNFGMSKVKQTSAECKTNNEVFGLPMPSAAELM